MPKAVITAEKLHALLEREFLQARLHDCVTRCRMPRPIFRESPGSDGANWHIVPPLKCPRHCHRIIEDVVARLAAAYDLEPPARLPA